MSNQKRDDIVDRVIVDICNAQNKLQTKPLTEEEARRILICIKSLTMLVVAHTKK